MTGVCSLASHRRPEHRGSLLKAVLVLLVVSLSIRTGHGAFGDAISSTCPFKDPSTESWVHWSDSSTWPNGKIPGVDPSKPTSVLIPCGQSVLLDMPSLQLGLLNVSGHLKLLDDPSLPLITINVTAIIVFGQLTIGSAEQQFSNRVNITLLANGTQEQYVTIPGVPSSLQSVGEKVFAVVGGQVNLHGMPGGAETPSWVRLLATARANATSVQVDADVSKWPVGSRVAIASTDYDMEQAETVNITGVLGGPGGSTVLEFYPPLRYMHWGDDMESGVPGILLNEKAEVALLTRNIVIQGQREGGSRKLVGGHFIVHNTATPQFIEGVELIHMGQQGQLGRYPMHFHICRSHPNSYVRKLSVQSTLQRCLVVHGTDDLLVEENVAFNVTGHCYMTEDGIEVNNTFTRNFGAVAYPATVLIPPQFDDNPNTDDEPALFWMANANNTLLNNVAGGSQGPGFWYQFEESVRGISQGLPGATDVSPRFIPIKLFENNTAHSCGQGVTTYVRGFNPELVTHPAFKVNLTTPVPTWLTGFNAYKNYYGIFPHKSQWVFFRNAILSDNVYSMHLTGWNLHVTSSVVVAETANVGTPSICSANAFMPDCLPLDTCALPANGVINATFRVRSIQNPGEKGRRRVIGLVLKEDGYPLPALNRGAILVSGVTFVGFSPRCDVDYSAISTDADASPGTSFNPGHTLENLTLINCTRPVYFNPAETWNATSDATASSPPNYSFNDAGWSHAIKDIDGSIIGPSPSSNSISSIASRVSSTDTAEWVYLANTAGSANKSAPPVGFVVSNSSHMLPLKIDTKATCYAEPSWNAYRCWGVCYRTLWVYYYEPGFDGEDTSVRSSLRVTRVADGTILMLTGTSAYAHGSMVIGSNFWRAFSVNLIVGPNYIYTIQKVGGKKPTMDPAWMYFGFEDDSANCGLSSRVRLLTNSSSSTYQSQGNGGGFPFYKYCEAPTESNKSTYVTTHCDSGDKLVLEANLGTLGPLNEMPLINATLRPATSGACSQNATCGLIAPGDTWQYVDSWNATEVPFPQELAATNGTLSGRTPVATGFLQFNDAHYSVVPHDDLLPPTITASQPETLYLWTTFTVSNASCYSNLTIGVKAKYGHAVFLNGVPVLVQRLTSNATGLLYSTQASFSGSPDWEQTLVLQPGASAVLKNQTRLLPGMNTVAVEVHQSAPGTPSDQIYFDFWMTAANMCA